MALTIYIGIIAVIVALIVLTAFYAIRYKRDLDERLALLRSLIDVWLSKKKQSYTNTAEGYDKHATYVAEEPEPETGDEPSETSKLLFAKIVNLMEYDHIYTDESLTRDTIAKRLNTNYKYVVKAIKECDNGNSLTNFVNTYRLQHATQLLSETNDPIYLVAEMSGLSQRTLTRLFQTQFGMTPMEYRKKKA
ncbi:MAG: helix-turn-helix transcriptional regulator [Prevotella sp.]